EEFADAARGIFGYVRRDLLSSEGAFWSAEDADSEGEEGRFYVWTPAEIAAVLPPGEAEAFGAHYDVTPHGNFEDGRSILHEPYPAPAGAAEERARFAPARAALLEARSRRPRPHRDDKVLTAWNGLM